MLWRQLILKGLWVSSAAAAALHIAACAMEADMGAAKVASIVLSSLYVVAVAVVAVMFWAYVVPPQPVPLPGRRGRVPTGMDPEDEDPGVLRRQGEDMQRAAERNLEEMHEVAERTREIADDVLRE